MQGGVYFTENELAVLYRLTDDYVLQAKGQGVETKVGIELRKKISETLIFVRAENASLRKSQD